MKPKQAVSRYILKKYGKKKALQRYGIAAENAVITRDDGVTAPIQIPKRVGSSLGRSSLGKGPDISMQWDGAIRFRIILTTCDRPKRLRLLIGDLVRETQGYDVGVVVVDDGVVALDEDAQNEIFNAGWQYQRSRHRFGKEGYGDLLRRALKSEFDLWQTAGRPKGTLWMVMQDDFRLCQTFFGRLTEAWREGRRYGAVALQYHVDKSRRDWCGPLGKAVDEVNWLDACTVASRVFWKQLGWNIYGHRSGPGKSSGVGNWLTARLAYDFPNAIAVRAKDSLVVHARGPSTMNPDVSREADAMRTVRFVDGDEERDRLEQ